LRNGNRPEFYTLREQIIVAINNQRLKLEPDDPHFPLP
jgi:hypothetical protein